MLLKFNFVTRYFMRLKNFYLALMSVFALEIVSSNENGIVLDGVLTKDEWNQSIEFDLEYELMPSRNTPAGLKTTAYVKFDKKYLYIGIKAFGDPKKIRATLKNRDQTWNEDYVALMFDPFRDGRYGILIGVNALGVQLDEIHISNAEPDNSWDILFDSATALQNDGYSAEFIIPFAELQLPDEEVQKWKMGFIREILSGRSSNCIWIF